MGLILLPVTDHASAMQLGRQSTTLKYTMLSTGAHKDSKSQKEVIPLRANQGSLAKALSSGTALNSQHSLSGRTPACC